MSDIDDRDLRGSTLADYLIAIEADLEIREGNRIIYAEPRFPVVELARSLASWMADRERADFVFESLSFEESGVVTITRTRAGWRLSSVFTPEVVSSDICKSELEAWIQQIIDRVATDLTERGHDADRILRGSVDKVPVASTRGLSPSTASQSDQVSDAPASTAPSCTARHSGPPASSSAAVQLIS